MALFFAAISFRLDASRSRRAKVLVIHSYDDSGQDGSYFQKRMSKAFRKSGKIPEIHHFYFDLIYGIETQTGMPVNSMSLIEEIYTFSPDILLVNDDPAFEYILEHNEELFKSIPTVFAGVTVADWDRNEFPLLCGFIDKVDLATNGDISMALKNSQNPTCVLDFDEWDDQLRQALYENISDTTKYINNGDFHIQKLDKPFLSQKFKDKVVFNFFSVKNRERNHAEGSDDSLGFQNTNNAYSMASLDSEFQIQVKYDICSNSIINLCPSPQLTAIREQFSPFSKSNQVHRLKDSPLGKIKNPPFLGGYFTSTDIQIQDQVNYAIRILNGDKPRKMEIGSHSKQYYMDWIAMQMMQPPLDYDAYKSQYVIVNVPYFVSHKYQSIFGIMSLFLLVGILLTQSVFYIWKKQKNKKTDIIRQLDTERKRRTMSMRGMEAEFFTLQNNLFRFYFAFRKRHNVSSPYYLIHQVRKWVDPISLTNFDSIVSDDIKKKGDRRTRIKMDIAGEGAHWWDVYYKVSDSLNGAFTGVIIQIDDIVADEEKVKANIKKAEEVAAKEYFIANITHDIRTPLNAIAGFSQIMVSGCTSEEAAEYSDIISDNADQMLNLIDEAVHSSLDDVDNIENYRLTPVNIAKVALRSYSTNLVLVPPYLQFIFDPESTDKEVMINADIYYLNRVINNLIGNAFKYTPQGSVTFGWHLIDSGRNIELFVKDTGIGIDVTDQQAVFDRFFTTKNNLAGTGLGLYITKKIIENIGGTIKLISKPGAGSTFSCIIPVIQVKWK